MNIKTCVQHKVHYPVSMRVIYYWTDITFLLFFSDQKSFSTLPKQLRDRGCGNKSWWLLHLCVWGPGGSSRWLITAWQQQGSSLLFRKPNSYPGPGPYLISKVIFVCVCFFAINHLPPLYKNYTLLKSHHGETKQGQAFKHQTLSSCVVAQICTS